MIIMISGNSITIETEGHGFVKGGKHPIYSEAWTLNQLKNCKPRVYQMLLAAEVHEDSWYCGRCSTIKTTYMRQGLFEIYDYFDGKKWCKELEVIEECPINYDTHGNGQGVAECFMESAAAFYERIQWPNGRKCYTVVKHF